MEFIEYNPTCNRLSNRPSRKKIGITFHKMQTKNKNSYSLVIRIGEEVLKKADFIGGNKINLFYANEDKSIFILKKIESPTRKGWKLSKKGVLQVRWYADQLFIPDEDREVVHQVKYELVPDGIKIYSGVIDED